MKQSILLISLFISAITYGQVERLDTDENSNGKRKFFDDISVGISLNHSLLRGDATGLSDQFLNDDIDSFTGGDKIDMGFGIRISKHLNRLFDLGIEFNMSNMTGVKKHDSNKNFNTRETDIDYTNFNLTSRFYFSKLIARKIRRPILQTYLDFAGGVLMSKATSIIVHDGIDGLSEEPISTDETSLLLGFGGGVEVRIARGLSADLGTKLLYSSSDDVDAINDDIEQNKYKDAFLLTHLGLNLDLSKRLDDSVTKKWHLRLKEKVETIEEEELVESAVKLTDTIYVHTVDTVVVTKVDTVIKEVDTRIVLSPVYFDSESAIVKEDQLSAIEKAAEYLINNPNTYLSLNGFTDERGPEEYNMGLSERRVSAVRKILVNIYKIKASRVKSSHHGENNLKLDQDELNRRVDLDVK